MSAGHALLNIDKEGTPSTKLGPKMGMESRSLTRTLKTMEENGLIYKTQDEYDGRLVLLHLTDDGKKYRDTSREGVLKLNEFIHGNIEQEKLETFFEVSNRINELLDNSNIYELKESISPTNK